MKIEINGDDDGIALVIAALTLASAITEGRSDIIDDMPHKETMSTLWAMLARDLYVKISPELTYKAPKH